MNTYTVTIRTPRAGEQSYTVNALCPEDAARLVLAMVPNGTRLHVEEA